MTPDIAELIGRVEKATGPDRELDEAIVRALCPDAIIEFYVRGDDEKTVFHAEPLVPNKSYLPEYTRSIDAALSLVPEGYTVETHSSVPRDRDNTVMLWKHHALPKDGLDARGEGATLALALCVAALRARNPQ